MSADDANINLMTAWHAGYGAGYNNGRVDGYQQGRQAHAEAEIANPALEHAQTEQRARVECNPQELKVLRERQQHL